MAFRFGLLQKDRSIALWTEGLGYQPFHGRIALLMNEHTHSAAEMVAAFAKENALVRTIGVRTAGEVLGGANFRVGAGYRVRLPVAAWYPWSENVVEGRGIDPDHDAPVTFEDLLSRQDHQLQQAEKLLREM